MTGEAHDRVEVVTIGGKVVCVYVNDHRVAGRKPYVSEGGVHTTFKVPIGEIRQKLKRKPREKK